MSKVSLRLLLISLILFSCSGKGKKVPAAEGGAQAPPVSVARPQVKKVVLYKEYPGYLSSNKSTPLVARVSGYLWQINYDPGQYVKKGHLLFVIEPTLYRNAVNEAKAQLESAQAQLDYAESNYERMKEASLSDAISEIDLIQAKSNLDRANADLLNARAQLSTAQTNLSYCYVKAPFDGQVTLSPYGTGDYINGAGQPVTLATLYDNSIMFVHFSISDNQYLAAAVSDKELRELPVPDSLSVSFGEGYKKQYPGQIDYLSPNVDLTTGTLSLRAKLMNPDGELKSGFYVTVKLPYGVDEKAVLVNNASVGTNQSGKYLYVVNDSSVVHFRNIDVGQLVEDTLRIVTSGISPGELYVTKALQKVRNGMKIKPVEQ